MAYYLRYRVTYSILQAKPTKCQLLKNKTSKIINKERINQWTK